MRRYLRTPDALVEALLRCRCAAVLTHLLKHFVMRLCYGSDALVDTLRALGSRF